MPRLGKIWLGKILPALAVATGLLVLANANCAVAALIEPTGHASAGIVSLVNCKTGNKNCETSSGLQNQLQNKLKKGGGTVGGGEQQCKGPTCGNCAADPTNCGDAAAKKNATKNGTAAATVSKKH